MKTIYFDQINFFPLKVIIRMCINYLQRTFEF